MALLTDDVFTSMPPMPFEYEGRELVARFCANILQPGRRFDLVVTRANGQPAFGTYLRSDAGGSRGTGLIVLTLAGDRISGLIRFERTVLPWFGLPPALPAAAVALRSRRGSGRRTETELLIGQIANRPDRHMHILAVVDTP